MKRSPQAIRADLLDFTEAPSWGEVGSSDGALPKGVRHRPDHWLLIDERGVILGAQTEEPVAGFERLDRRGHLLMPGFLDSHVHSAQLGVLASYGSTLLDWLETYTFPHESRFADEAFAAAEAERFLDALLAQGTTAAMVFPTVHEVAADALFRAADARGMRLISGKILMDRHAPSSLCDSVIDGRRATESLIQRWHGRGRLSYAITPRFAPTSTPEQLAMAGQWCRDDPTLYMQTHVAENTAEVQWVRELFPQARSYLDVYDQAGLLHPRSVLAHGIWLDEADRAVLQARGASIAHCPTSNLFLGSGLFDWQQARAQQVGVSVASDVGGGTSLNLLRNLVGAYQIQAMRGERLTAWCALDAVTRGAAQTWRLGHEIGSLEAGCVADLCLWRWGVDAVSNERIASARSLHEKVFAWMTLCDERALAQVWVAGQPVRLSEAEPPATA
jgi:guanine deaminase